VGTIERQSKLADLALEGIRLLVPIVVASLKRRRRKGRPVGQVALRGVLLLPGRPELHAPVLADRIEKAEPAPAVRADRGDRQGSIRQPNDRLDRVDVRAAADRCHRGRWDSRRERRHPSEDGLVAVVEELVAPVERRPQCAVARDRGATTVGEEAEPIVEPIEHVLRFEHAKPGGRHLNRQRQAVEPVTDPGHRREVRVRPGSTRADPAGSVQEQADGI
jgi:hypothetical protein